MVLLIDTEVTENISHLFLNFSNAKNANST